MLYFIIKAIWTLSRIYTGSDIGRGFDRIRAMMKPLKSLLLLVLFLMSSAHADEMSVRMLSGENWWGLCSNFGRQMPFNEKSDFQCDLRVSNYSHQSQSILVSDKGRVLYCDAPVEATIGGGTIRFVADKGNVILPEKAGETLRIRLPASDLCMPRVVRVTLDGAPDVDTRLMPQNGELILLPKSGGRALSCDATSRCRVTEHGTLTDWARPGDGISWKVHFPEAGRYGVSVRTETWAHAQAWEDGRTAEISIGGERLTGVLRKDRDLPHTAYDRAESDFGVVDVRAAGDSEVVLRTVRTTEKAKYQDVLALVLTRIEK